MAGFETPPDSGGDGVRDFVDNCIFAMSPDQRDTDLDGFGNLCDPDFNNDGGVNFVDLGIFKSLFGQTPGPSGFAP